MSNDQIVKPLRQPDLLAAALLGLPAILSFFLILHHPTLRGVHGADDVAQRIHGIATLDGVVHGGLILLYAMQAVGFYLFSARLGWRHPAVVAAFMTYVASVIVLIIPATLDGFVTPDIIAGCLAQPGGCGEAEKAGFPIVGAMIGAFTKVALVATSIATILWSLALLPIRRRVSGAAGLGGLICGGTPMAIVMFSNIHLQPGNLAGVILSQVVWSLIAGGMMISATIENGADILGSRVGRPD